MMTSKLSHPDVRPLQTLTDATKIKECAGVYTPLSTASAEKTDMTSAPGVLAGLGCQEP